jgi:hypothetical protein
MWLHLYSFWTAPACKDGPPEGPNVVEAATITKPKRRGVTAMEYLVVISFILTVLILAVQGLGNVTRGLFKNSEEETRKTVPTSGS